MFRYISKNKGLIILVALVLAGFLWMTSQIREPGGPTLLERGLNTAAYPFVKAIDSFADTIKGVWTGYIYLTGLASENEKLEKANGRLAKENTALREKLARSGRLEDLRRVELRADYPSIAAGVVGRDPSSWFRTIWVDAGGREGVAANMPVAQYTGLAGRVMKTYRGSSRVMLVTHPGSSVSCILERSRDTGILSGDGTGTCRLDYVEKKADVKAGDLVITSGLDRVYPKGMPVGVVTRVVQDAPGFFQDVRVTPTAELSHLEDVLIIAYRPEARQ